MLQQHCLPGRAKLNIHKTSSATCLGKFGNQWAAATKAKNTRQLVTSHVIARTATQVADLDDHNVNTWTSFAAKASGEWEGVSVTFSPSGEPQQLPEHYVPEAFREWGVELRDWQTQCSCIAVTTEDGKYDFRCTLRRLMPTVGCEADAIAFTEEQTSSSSSSSSEQQEVAAGASSTVIAATADGCYNMGPDSWPSSADETITKLAIEHCFMMPEPQQQQQQQQRYRVKVVQQFRRNWLKGGAWQLDSVDLHKERYDGPFTGKRELAGCGGGQQPIAQLMPLQQQQLMQGNWLAAAAAAAKTDKDHDDQILLIKSGSICASGGTSSSSSIPGLLVDGLQTDAAAAAALDHDVQLTLLPLDVWSAVVVGPQGMLLQAEAGLLLNPGSSSNSSSDESDSTAAGSSRLVSVRKYGAEDGLLQNAILLQQMKQ